MVSFIYCICDCRYTVGIADHSYKRCAVTERIRKCASGTLTECTDYRSSRNQDLLLIFCFAENSVRTDFETATSGMYSYIFFNLF